MLLQDDKPPRKACLMCESCGCQAVSVIADLTREHDRALDAVRAAGQASTAGDPGAARAALLDLERVLAPHTAALADRLLDEARVAGSGRAAHTPVGGSGHALRHTVIALRAGQELAEHSSPGEATLLVLRGAVEMWAGQESEAGVDGDLMVVPARAHRLKATQDSVVLLTVVKV